MALPTVVLKPGRDRSLKRLHPWIFNNAINKVKGAPALGDSVSIITAEGQPLGVAAYSPHSQIRARMWHFGPGAELDVEFFITRLQSAQRLRNSVIQRQQLTGYRLIAAESDGLPGIIIDRYAQFLVLQILSAGAERHKGLLLEALHHCYPECHLYERSDTDMRKREGLPQSKGVLQGDAPTAETIISENGLQIAVDIEHGHKTGFYLDQRDNRSIAGQLAAGADVLNCFSYTGTFALYCLKGGAKSVVNVDASELALRQAQRNLVLNQLDDGRCQQQQADVFKLLREYQQQGRQFDMIILDPPKFADTKAQLKGACRGYKDINLQAIKLLRPGGQLLTFSCSGLMPADLFQKIVADAALDAGRPLRFTKHLTQAEDHPIASPFPEGFYLKGLVAQVD